MINKVKFREIVEIVIEKNKKRGDNISKISGFILDLDGVITDTAEYHFRAWKRLAEEERISFTREDNEKLRGVSRRESLEILLKNKEVTEQKKQEMMTRKNNYYQKLINKLDENDLIPGVKELINKIREKGFKLAVASSSKNARTVIANLGINHFFDTISDGNSVDRPKPAPDLFLHTAEKLNIPAQNCVVIEDAEAGIKAALKAEMIAIGIGPQERVGKAHYRYDRVRDINLEKIL